jgi:hypothetical protein
MVLPETATKQYIVKLPQNGGPQRLATAFQSTDFMHAARPAQATGSDKEGLSWHNKTGLLTFTPVCVAF